MNWTVFKWQLRSLTLKRRLGVIIAFLVFPCLLAFTIDVGGSPSEQSLVNLVFLTAAYPAFTSALLALLHGTSFLKEEQEGGTIVYLLTSPVPRWKIFFSKLAATICLLFVFTSASFMLSLFILGGVEMEQTLRLLVAILTATIGYNTFFFLVSVILPNKTMTFGVILGVAEVAISFLPAIVNRATTSFYTRSIVLSPLQDQVDSRIMRSLGDQPLVLSVLFSLILAAITFAVACALIRGREYLPSRDD